ncbi:MAG TPA: hypothetical protein VMX55_11020 [candidate division Zixibacteria bacterium]|nr:hypothetical protein [candidate division Zixibacteria bacterium]
MKIHCPSCDERNDTNDEFCKTNGEKLRSTNRALAFGQSPFSILSIISFVIGCFSIGLFWWVSMFLTDNPMQGWLGEIGCLVILCIFLFLTICGLILGTISIRKVKKIYSILGVVFNGLVLPFLLWALIIYIYLLTEEPYTGYSLMSIIV